MQTSNGRVMARHSHTSTLRPQGHGPTGRTRPWIEKRETEPKPVFFKEVARPENSSNGGPTTELITGPTRPRALLIARLNRCDPRSTVQAHMRLLIDRRAGAHVAYTPPTCTTLF